MATAAEEGGGAGDVCACSCDGEACRCDEGSEVERETCVILYFVIQGCWFEPLLLVSVFFEPAIEEGLVQKRDE